VLPFNRRVFLLGAAGLAAGAESPESSALDPNTLEKFVDPLPIPPRAMPRGHRAVPGKSGEKVPYYRIAMRQFAAKVHRDLPATTMWGYEGISPGPTIETLTGQGVMVEWVNSLPVTHLLPVDHNVHGAEANVPAVRAVVHIHGAKTPPESDGYPEAWYVPGKSATYYYPNQQDASPLWYHDHTMGINRLNVYAGLLGLFTIRDPKEDALNLPRGPYEIPLIIYDRSFRRDGRLDYPVSGIADAPWVPEAMGEAMMVNGKMFPHLEVEPRKYRFRMLNAANGRFFHLSLSNKDQFYVIGSDQGLMAAPAAADSVLIAPGERADLVIDFGGHAGQRIVLDNDAFQVMQFRVSRDKVNDGSVMPAKLRDVPRTPESNAVRTRRILLTENKMGNGDSMMMLLNGMHWDMPVTEKPLLNSTEIWELVNTTDDSHPIHLHLVRFQLLDRRSFNELLFYRTRQLNYIAPAEAPEPWETGWKDTVRAHSNMVTRIIVKFEGYTGRYVWHCHILEHEDNEMMRPYEVLPA
jgi:spore coat protein A